jgi:hypothetical protein
MSRKSQGEGGRALSIVYCNRAWTMAAGWATARQRSFTRRIHSTAPRKRGFSFGPITAGRCKLPDFSRCRIPAAVCRAACALPRPYRHPLRTAFTGTAGQAFILRLYSTDCSAAFTSLLRPRLVSAWRYSAKGPATLCFWCSARTTFFVTTAPLALSAGLAASAAANPAAVHRPRPPRPGWRRGPAAAAGGSMAGTDMRGRESSGAGAGPGDETVAWPAVMAGCGGSGISGDDARRLGCRIVGGRRHFCQVGA